MTEIVPNTKDVTEGVITFMMGKFDELKKLKSDSQTAAQALYEERDNLEAAKKKSIDDINAKIGELAAKQREVDDSISEHQRLVSVHNEQIRQISSLSNEHEAREKAMARRESAAKEQTEAAHKALEYASSTLREAEEIRDQYSNRVSKMQSFIDELQET
jgi:chromosome segregation ATPase